MVDALGAGVALGVALALGVGFEEGVALALGAGDLLGVAEGVGDFDGLADGDGDLLGLAEGVGEAAGAGGAGGAGGVTTGTEPFTSNVTSRVWFPVGNCDASIARPKIIEVKLGDGVGRGASETDGTDVRSD